VLDNDKNINGVYQINEVIGSELETSRKNAQLGTELGSWTVMIISMIKAIP
jgi:hypothetical protein